MVTSMQPNVGDGTPVRTQPLAKGSLSSDQVCTTSARRPARRPSPAPVVIVGGSLAGLSAAILLAEQGREVVVLEGRLDPRSEAGQAAIAQAAELFGQADSARQAGHDATRLEKEAQASLSRTWASRNRSIDLDRFSVDWLQSHGVDVSGFPVMRYLDLAEHQRHDLKVSARIGKRLTTLPVKRLDLATMVFQRDISHQPLISQVEQALYAAAVKHPKVRVVFDAKVTSHRETPTGVELGLGNDKALAAAQVVVADGGGNGSVTELLGVGRDERARELLATVVIKVDKSADVLGHRASDAGSTGKLIDGGWVGINSSGDGYLAVNVRGTPGKPPQDPLEVARKAGIRGRVASAPSTFAAPLDAARDFVVGSRTFLIGNAAVRGSPMLGLSGQLAFLSSQTLTDAFARGGKHGPSADAIERFRRTMKKSAEDLLDFEADTMRLMDGAEARTLPMSQVLASPKLLGAISRSDVDYDRRDGRLVFDLRLDSSRLSDGNDLYAKAGRIVLAGDVPARVAEGGVVLEPSAQRPIRLVTDLETINLTSGTCSIEQRRGDWHLVWRNVVMEREATTADGERRASRMTVDHMDALLPGPVVDTLLAGLEPGKLPKVGGGPLTVTAQLRSCSLDFAGKLISLHDNPEVVTAYDKTDGGATTIGMTFKRGSMTLDNAGDYNMQAKPSIGLATIGRFWQSIPITGKLIATPLISAVTRAYKVHQATFLIRPDGSARAQYDGTWLGNRMPMGFDLEARDIERFLGDLDAQAVGGLSRSLQSALEGIRVRVSSSATHG